MDLSDIYLDVLFDALDKEMEVMKVLLPRVIALTSVLAIVSAIFALVFPTTIDNKRLPLKAALKTSQAEDDSGVRKVCQVFWDYENIHKPKEVTFEVAYAALRDQMGNMNMTLQRVNIYCDEDVLEAKGRQCLHDLGCAVINPSKTTGNTKKSETVDMRMAVDIGMFAYDNSHAAQDCAIVLISSDSDFGYLLSQVRNRKFEIILICNKNAPARLTTHANRMIRVYDLFVQSENSTPAEPSLAVTSSAMEERDVEDGDDTSSIASQQHNQAHLRVDDLVSLVHELEAKSPGRLLFDSAVGVAFSKRFPALSRKGVYAEIKQAAIQSGQLFASVKPNPPHPSAHLISTSRPWPYSI